MTRTTWFALELLWKVMVVLAVALSLSARAEPPLEPERLAQGPLQERQRQSTRHVLATSNSNSLVIGEGGSIWVWGTGRGEDLGTWPEYEIGSATPRDDRRRRLASAPGADASADAVQAQGADLGRGRARAATVPRG